MLSIKCLSCTRSLMLKVVGVLQQSVLLSRFNLETLRFCSNVLTNFSNCILSLQVKSADVFYVTSYDSVAVFSISC